MKLLDEIIDLAASEKGSVATLLRKCLILSHSLKNDRLKAWAENELNGYDANDDGVPSYRRTTAAAKGLFLGPFGALIDNQPIPPGILHERHRRFAESAVLPQPIAAYENLNRDSLYRIEWPANLTVVYQKAFFKGDFALNRAWQEIPASIFVGLIDTIKTRVLRFALELKEELGLVSDDLDELPKDKIDQQVTTYIFGGNNVIASRDFTQTNSIKIKTGDWTALADALVKRLGIDASAVSDLKVALDHDSTSTSAPGLGKRAVDWLKHLGKKSSGIALSIGVEVAKKEATNWILQYLGHHGD